MLINMQLLCRSPRGSTAADFTLTLSSVSSSHLQETATAFPENCTKSCKLFCCFVINFSCDHQLQVNSTTLSLCSEASSSVRLHFIDRAVLTATHHMSARSNKWPINTWCVTRFWSATTVSKVWFDSGTITRERRRSCLRQTNADCWQETHFILSDLLPDWVHYTQQQVIYRIWLLVSGGCCRSRSWAHSVLTVHWKYNLENNMKRLKRCQADPQHLSDYDTCHHRGWTERSTHEHTSSISQHLKHHHQEQTPPTCAELKLKQTNLLSALLLYFSDISFIPSGCCDLWPPSW